MNFDTSDFLFLQRETAERIEVQLAIIEPKMLTKVEYRKQTTFIS